MILPNQIHYQGNSNTLHALKIYLHLCIFIHHVIVFTDIIVNDMVEPITNKPYEAGGLCFNFDVPFFVCILLPV